MALLTITVHGCRSSAAKPGGRPRVEDLDTDFVAAKAFTGARAGFSFKQGSRGMGYYRDDGSLQTLAAGNGKLAKPVARESLAVASAVEDEEGGAASNLTNTAGSKRKSIPGRLRKKLKKQALK
jgi:hypothetical protein